MSEGVPSKKSALQGPQRNPFLGVDCSAAAIGAALARREFGSFFTDARKAPRLTRPHPLSMKSIGEHIGKVRTAMNSLLDLITRKSRGRIPSEPDIEAAWTAYDQALKALAALTPSTPLKEVERRALLPPLSAEQEASAKQLAGVYLSLKESIAAGVHISLNWDFYAMDRLAARFSAEDAARLLVGSKKSAAEIFKELNDGDKEFVLRVLGKAGECTADDLQQFVDLNPGVRDLRVKNILASIWTAERWGLERDSQGNEAHPLSRLGEAFAAFRERKMSLYSLCQLPSATDAEKLEAVFRMGDLTPLQRSFIASFLGVDAGALKTSHLMEFDRRVSELGPAERRGLWKLGRKDLLTLAQIAHKMRFSPEEVSATTDEQAFICKIFGTSRVSDNDLGELNEALIRKTSSDEDGHKWYLPLVLAAYDAGGASMGWASLLEAARADAEIAVLLEFMGMPLEKVSASLDFSRGMSRSNPKKAGSRPNEDSFASGDVRLADGTVILLDAVFDGMGGHDDGALASGIARNIFCIATLAGWIREPEDTRRLLLLIDLAILMEQIRRKNTPTRASQDNNMGSTGVVCFQHGSRFYGAHCGDSRYDVQREGKVAFSSVPHDLRNSPSPSMAPQDQAELLKRVGNLVTSALGADTPHIHINNKPLGADPFLLEDDDLVRAATDGFFKSVCDGEVAILVEDAGGDLVKARKDAIELAADRNGGMRNTMCALGCGCGGQIKGVKDDKTFTLRLAKQGFVEVVG